MWSFIGFLVKKKKKKKKKIRSLVGLDDISRTSRWSVDKVVDWVSRTSRGCLIRSLIKVVFDQASRLGNL